MPLKTEEIREVMSGNICRCGAYPNIVAVIEQVVGEQVVGEQVVGEQVTGEQVMGGQNE